MPENRTSRALNSNLLSGGLGDVLRERRLVASSSASGAPSTDFVGAQERGLALEIGIGHHRAAAEDISQPAGK